MGRIRCLAGGVTARCAAPPRCRRSSTGLARPAVARRWSLRHGLARSLAMRTAVHFSGAPPIVAARWGAVFTCSENRLGPSARVTDRWEARHRLPRRRLGPRNAARHQGL